MWKSERQTDRETDCRSVDLFTFRMVFDVAFIAFSHFSMCVCVSENKQTNTFANKFPANSAAT